VNFGVIFLEHSEYEFVNVGKMYMLCIYTAGYTEFSVFVACIARMKCSLRACNKSLKLAPASLRECQWKLWNCVYIRRVIYQVYSSTAMVNDLVDTYTCMQGMCFATFNSQ